LCIVIATVFMVNKEKYILVGLYNLYAYRAAEGVLQYVWCDTKPMNLIPNKAEFLSGYVIIVFITCCTPSLLFCRFHNIST